MSPLSVLINPALLSNTKGLHNRGVFAFFSGPMSLDIDWSKLDQELAIHVQHFLNRHFKSISKPAFIGDIEVTAFEWGTEAPRIEITNITDPFPEFYEDDDDDDELAPQKSNGGTRTQNDQPPPPTPTGSSSTTPPSTDGLASHTSAAAAAASEPCYPLNPARFSFNNPLLYSQQQRFNLMHSFHRSPFVAPQHPYHSPPLQQERWAWPPPAASEAEDWIDDDDQYHMRRPPPPPSSSVQSTTTISNNNNTAKATARHDPTEMDFQTSLLISYKGDMSMTLLTELRMNYPSMMFMSLPIQLRVRSVEFEATAVVAYIKSMNRVCVSMLEPEEEISRNGGRLER